MANLRQRRHEQTRHAIVDAAFTLFRERGFSDVTMEEIAGAAGLSRSTLYRRFATKEDIVIEVPSRWLEAFDEAAASLPVTTSLVEAAATTAGAVAAYIDRDRALVLAAYEILEQIPTLRTSGVATTAWLQRMVGLVEQYGDFDAATNAVVAGAYMGAIDSMMLHWAASGGTESVTTATRRLHDRLRLILVG